MKKIIVSAIIITLLILVVVFHGIFSTGIPLGTVTLQNQDDSVTLTGAEAQTVTQLLTYRSYNYGIGGCPFNAGITITIGNREFALATDGCYSAKDVERNEYVAFDHAEWQQIVKLFTDNFESTLLR